MAEPSSQPVDPRAWAAPRPRGLPRYVPIAGWLVRYDRRFLRFDVIAGLTLWGLLIPEVMAYAGLAGMPPQAGLYTLLATLGAYAIFGTSRHLVAGATSAAAVLLASTVAGLHPADTQDYAADGAVLVLICGGLLLAAGLLRLGFVAQFVSRPVMESFVVGLAIYVAITQLPTLLGVEKGHGNAISQLGHVLSHLSGASGATFAVGAGALALLWAGDRLAPKLPFALLALVLGVVASSVLHLDDHGVAVVGHVPSGLPTPHLPSIDTHDVPRLLRAAAGMVLVIFSESLGAAKSFAAKYRYDIDTDQELVALGVANLGSGLLGGLAGGGSLSQSAVNERAGARSEVSPLVAALLVVVTVLVLTPLFEHLPEAVLAALIIHAVSRLLRLRPLGQYYAAREAEFWLGLATIAGVLFLNVLPGLLIGVGSMLLLVIYNLARAHVAVLGRRAGVPGAYVAVRRHRDTVPVDGALVLRVESPLLYANAAPVRDRIKRLVGTADPTPRAIVLELGATERLDVTSAQVLDDLVAQLHAAGIDVGLTDVRHRVKAMAERSGLLATLGEDRIFDTVDAALETMLSPPSSAR